MVLQSYRWVHSDCTTITTRYRPVFLSETTELVRTADLQERRSLRESSVTPSHQSVCVLGQGKSNLWYPRRVKFSLGLVLSCWLNKFVFKNKLYDLLTVPISFDQKFVPNFGWLFITNDLRDLAEITFIVDNRTWPLVDEWNPKCSKSFALLG